MGLANAETAVTAKATKENSNTKIMNAVVQNVLNSEEVKNITTQATCETSYEKVCAKNYTKANEVKVCNSTKTAGCKIIMDKLASTTKATTK